MSASKKEDYLNKKYTLLDGSNVKIIEYDTCKNITIKFDYGYIIKTTMISLKSRNFKHPNQKTVYGVGYIGMGTYNVSDDRVLYDKWKGMLRRCYDKKFQEKQPTYKDCVVDECWHNFQVFAEWYNKKRKIFTMVLALDKDILFKGNKIYSPETCCLVPQRINSLLIKRDNGRGEYPLGVSYNSRDNTYVAELPKNKKGKRNFKTVVEAFELYKRLKEEHIKDVINEFRDLIDPEVYQALYNYKVEITD